MNNFFPDLISWFWLPLSAEKQLDSSGPSPAIGIKLGLMLVRGLSISYKCYHFQGTEAIPD